VACAAKRPSAVKILLAFGANPSTTNKEGTPGLVASVNAGDAESVRLLAVASAPLDVQVTDEKKTALYIASEAGDYACVDALVAFGANTKIASFAGHTPADVGSASGYDDLYDYLSLEGAALQAERKKILNKWLSAAADEGANADQLLKKYVASVKAEFEKVKKNPPTEEKKKTSSSASSASSSSSSSSSPSTSSSSEKKSDKKSSHKSSSSKSSKKSDKKSSKKSS